MNNIDNLIKNLNKEQKEAVLSTEGPNLIVAGAGSGKTRVLTTRLIHIINEKKAWPNQILCVTFTNKAAKEMQNRVMQYIKGNSNAVPWLGTFHSISVKFLRRHAEALDYKSNFTILDTDDQKKLIRNIVKGEDLDAKKFSPQLIMYHIDQWKNKGLLPKDVKIENAVILLHGYGGDGRDISMLSLNWKRHLTNTIFLCPNGHEPCPINPSGYQWFDLTKDDPKYILNETIKAEKKLNQFIDEIKIRYKLENDKSEILKLIKERENARKNKNFDLADELRDKLKKMHIEIEDTPDGTKWFKTN